MGATKTLQYSDKINEFAILSKALGHPARVSILEYLMKTDDYNCNEIAGLLQLSQPTVSHHLGELRRSGLIIGRIVRNEIYYTINQERVSKLRSYLQLLIR